ncbi:hypothetical protein MRB53_006826 [Persea americana]|uniref:Uncharacterized protein n=1 Tax=Persea americana TaxID=3435 RepID=A0ACC2MHR9_PERAE|nr:hypothetical protein MRB53_006826 [Persea americana]
MTVKGGTSQACAACKYRRRKCNADCPLAPYFPPDDPKQFQNAHRLFGVSNILKILEQLNPEQKLEAMRSIVYQANMRERYPVHGCLGIIYKLQLVIHETQQALDAVNAQLASCKLPQLQISSPPISPSSQLQLAPATTPPANNALTLFHNNHHQQFNEMDIGNTQHLFPNVITADSCSNSNMSNDNTNNNDNVNQLWSHYSYQHSYYNNSPNVQSQFIVAQPVPTNGYDEMSNFLDNIDDRQSYVVSKEAYDSSPESSLKDTTQSMEMEHDQVGENKLNITATCLTSVN